MANPTPYNPSYSFSGWQASFPSKPLPAPQVDNEYANISLSLNGTITALADIRRSDGQLKNGIVGVDALSTGISPGFVLRGQWASGVNYIAADSVVYNNNFYRTTTPHLSATGNRPDQVGSPWVFLFSVGSLSGAMSAFMYDPQNKMADAFARANHTGTQAISTITNLQSTLDNKADDADISTVMASIALHLALSGGAMTGPIENAVFAAPGANTKRAHLDLTAVAAGQDRLIRVPNFDTATTIWETIEDVTLSSVANYSNTNLSAFRKVRISGSLFPGTATGIYMQLSAAGVFAAGASDYTTQYQGAQGAGGSQAATSASSILLTNGSDVAANADSAYTFNLEFERFNKANFSRGVGRGGWFNVSGQVLVHLECQRSAAVANDGIRILPGAGTMSGYVTLEGVRG